MCPFDACEELWEGLDQSMGGVDMYRIKIPLCVPIDGEHVVFTKFASKTYRFFSSLM